MKYMIVQNESSDWYVIPADKEYEWEDYVGYVMFADDLPAWAVSIGGWPSLVKFENWEMS